MLHWTASKADGPKRSYAAAAAVKNELYHFGGYYYGSTTTNNNDKAQMDVHVFNTVSLCWKELPPVSPGGGDGGHLEVPSRRHGHTAVLMEDPRDPPRIYVWGGSCGGRYYNVLHAFDVDAHVWSNPSVVSGRVSGRVPDGRCYHSACVLGKVMFIYGGYNWTWMAGSHPDCSNNMSKLDTSTMVWSLINTRGTRPRPSHCHSATVIGTNMFVFGGLGRQGAYNTISVFDTETNGWLNTRSAQLQPDACAGDHSAFAHNGELYIFGGYNCFNDVWKFSPETFFWKKVQPKGKGPTCAGGMCCCMVGDRIILFGGYERGNTPVDDLFVLDLSPTLKTLCKLVVIQYDLDQSELPHNTRWDLVAMTTNNS